MAVAQAAARQAADIQLAGMDSKLQFESKSTSIDIVTQIDRACESRIRQVISSALPQHAILGEEQGGTRSRTGFRWIVDPLDGTVNYANRIPGWCVSIALELDGRLLLGVILDPQRDETFSAIDGQGAWLNGLPLRVSAKTELRHAVVATGFSYQPELMPANARLIGKMAQCVRAVRIRGSAALDLAHVACGRLDAFWEIDLAPWDVAAGMLLVREAGGTVRNASGEDYRLGETFILAGPRSLAPELLDTIRT